MRAIGVSRIELLAKHGFLRVTIPPCKMKFIYVPAHSPLPAKCQRLDYRMCIVFINASNDSGLFS